MFKRLLSPLNSRSFFIFGARGTGKSTFLRENYSKTSNLYIDLLDPDQEQRLALNPSSLLYEISALKQKPDWVIIDEIQKVPKLLDLVQKLIEEKNLKFILSGSSARKLKRGSANLLAGRAFVYQLFPLTSVEIDKNFNLQSALRWGTLPTLFGLETDREKKSYLNSYIQTYFTEEIRAEQIIRKLDPFRAFLPLLGQYSGKIINHQKIASAIGVSVATVQSYFQIIEDTLMGFYLPGFHGSVRKSQRVSPKFYLFDTGVKKALEQSLDQPATPRTSVFGELFESFLINEIIRLNSYYECDFRFSYYATKNNSEVDLVLSKGQKNWLIEIKPIERVDLSEVKRFAEISKNFPNVEEAFYLSMDPVLQNINGIKCQHWLEFLKNFKSNF